MEQETAERRLALLKKTDFTLAYSANDGVTRYFRVDSFIGI